MPYGCIYSYRYTFYLFCATIKTRAQNQDWKYMSVGVSVRMNPSLIIRNHVSYFVINFFLFVYKEWSSSFQQVLQCGMRRIIPVEQFPVPRELNISFKILLIIKTKFYFNDKWIFILPSSTWYITRAILHRREGRGSSISNAIVFGILCCILFLPFFFRKEHLTLSAWNHIISEKSLDLITIDKAYNQIVFEQYNLHLIGETDMQRWYIFFNG